MNTSKAVKSKQFNRSSNFFLVTLFFVTLMFTQQAGAWVLDGDLYIDSQADLDNLQPGLEVVTGELIIGTGTSFNNITDLSKLSSLKTAEDIIRISRTAITNVDDLGSLEFANRLHIIGNLKLTNLDGFVSLKNIGIYLGIGYNYELTNLDGLESLQNPTIGRIQIYSNIKLTDISALMSVHAAIHDMRVVYNRNLDLFCGLANIANNSPQNIYWWIEGNKENPTRQEIIDGCGGPGTVMAYAYYDANQNGMVDAGEKAIKDVLIRQPNETKTTKHLTLENGKATFRNLPAGTNSFYVDMNSLPDGTVWTTEPSLPSLHVEISPENMYVKIYFGFYGNLEDRLGEDVEVPEYQMEEKCNPLVFVKGTPTYSDGKNSYGWENAVDCDYCSEAGATLAQADATSGDNVPWAIYQFQNGGTYKFDYVKFQTGFCDGLEKHKMTQRATRIEVLVSETGMDADDFVSVGAFNDKYSEQKMQWGRPAGEVKAKYVKVRLLNHTSGMYTQLVEFAVDNSDKTGPQPASEDMNLALVESFDTLSNYPNPFNPTTTIEYNLANDSKVSLTIYDITGKQVAELVNGFVQAGSHNISWNASNMPSGMYFMKLQTNASVLTQRMLLMK